MKTLARLATAALLLPALAACGSGSSAGSSAPSPSLAASPSASASSNPAEPAVQPCDAIKTGPIAAVLGNGLTMKTGTAASPTCYLIPTVTGGAIFQMSYMWWFDGGLDASWQTIAGNQIAGQVSTIKVPGADAAKLVVHSTASAAYVTGYIENGSLIQMANGEALPKNLARLEAATKVLLAQLSKGAPSSAYQSTSSSASPSAK